MSKEEDHCVFAFNHVLTFSTFTFSPAIAVGNSACHCLLGPWLSLSTFGVSLSYLDLIPTRPFFFFFSFFTIFHASIVGRFSDLDDPRSVSSFDSLHLDCCTPQWGGLCAGRWLPLFNPISCSSAMLAGGATHHGPKKKNYDAPVLDSVVVLPVDWEIETAFAV